MSRLAKTGDTVTVQYIGTLDNGRIFDRADEEPLQIRLGNDEVFPVLEAKICGMKAGEVKNIVVTAADAYGPRRPENVLRVERELFPPEKELKVGQKLSIEIGGGSQRVMVIIDHNEKEVVLDGNHPLAGCDLTFALKLVSID